MGHLTATLLTDPNKRFDNQNALIAQSNDPSKVIVQIRIGTKQVYTLLISGVSLYALSSIPTIIPCLEKIVRDTRPLNSDYDDPDYQTPRQLTYFGQGHSSHITTIAGSARALCNVLKGAIDNKGSTITSLITHCRDQMYFEAKSSWIFTTGLKCLKDLFSKIQPFHFKALTMLQVAIATDSKLVINGFSDLLSRNCFPNLKSLQLLCKGARVSYKEGQPILHDYHEQHAVLQLYQQGFNQSTVLPPIEHLELLFWCHDATQAALMALERIYPNLKSMTINLALPTAQKGGLKNTYSDSWETSNTFYTNTHITTYTTTHTFDLYATKLTIPPDQETNGIPTLRSSLAKMVNQSQLECLEIFDWPIAGEDTFADQMLADIISDGSLPKLDTIKISHPSLGSGFKFSANDAVVSDAIMDMSHSTLLSVVAEKVSLRKLFLVLPEKTGFMDWLRHISKDGFPLLEQFHYRVPTPVNELPDNHKARVKQALQYIDDAVTSGKLPKLTTLVIEGELPQEFVPWIQKIEAAVAKQNQALPSTETLGIQVSNQDNFANIDGMKFTFLPDPIAAV